jgi:small neutral amino acid transporter SnatA (MarC family)
MNPVPFYQHWLLRLSCVTFLIGLFITLIGETDLANFGVLVMGLSVVGGVIAMILHIRDDAQ